MCRLVVVKLSKADLELIRFARALLATGEAQQRREEAKLTRTELAAHVGCSADAVDLWEAGERIPRTEAAVLLGRFYRDLERQAARA